MNKIRLNKYLASLGLASRRKIDEMIGSGQILINGKEAKLGMQLDPEYDEVVINDSGLDLTNVPEREYWKFYKPRGVVSSLADSEGRPTIAQLINEAGIKTRLFPVGRLDVESEGLILLTNDGALAFKLTHPKYQVEKEYEVWANGNLSDKDLNRLHRGVILSDGKTTPAEVNLHFRSDNRCKFSIVIREGRNHQVRRMAAKVGLMVTRLKRIRMASLQLKEMKSGEFLKISFDEILRGKIE